MKRVFVNNTEIHYQGSVVLAKDQILTLALEGNPTTGYTWDIIEIDNNILQQIGDVVYQPESQLPGSPGVQIFRFKALNPGQTNLRLVYHRPWETVEPAKTSNTLVVVY